MTYRLGSLFDGSGGFPLAGSLCGIEPVWASEVEPYPIAVTRSRFPNMKHLGSVTDVHGGEIEPVDIITFGSPCFPAGTLVLTKKGYEPIENIRVGDEVFTHKGNWKPVSAIGYKYSRTVKMKGNHYGLIATPNHPSILQRRTGRRMEWEQTYQNAQKHRRMDTCGRNARETLGGSELYFWSEDTEYLSDKRKTEYATGNQ